MNRAGFVRRLVLNAICDDYENIDQIILPEVAKDGLRCGLTIERSEIADALAALIGDGLAQAYFLSSTEPSRELPGMPSTEIVEEHFETYFYVTPRGMELQLSDDAWWPFDEEDNLRPDWRLDT